MSAVARRMLGGIAVLALLLFGALATLPRAEADHCVWTGGAWVCAGDPTNPHHYGEDRIAGANRYATSAAISAATWDPGVERVYLANGNGIDAVAAGASVDGPILLVPTGDHVPAAVLAEIERLAPTVAVVALGGESVVSPAQLATAAVAAGFGQ